MSDGGRAGGELDPACARMLAKLVDPGTYKGLSRDDAQKLIDKAAAGLSKEDQRTVRKAQERGRRG